MVKFHLLVHFFSVGNSDFIVINRLVPVGKIKLMFYFYERGISIVEELNRSGITIV